MSCPTRLLKALCGLQGHLAFFCHFNWSINHGARSRHLPSLCCHASVSLVALGPGYLREALPPPFPLKPRATSHFDSELDLLGLSPSGFRSPFFRLVSFKAMIEPCSLLISCPLSFFSGAFDIHRAPQLSELGLSLPPLESLRVSFPAENPSVAVKRPFTLQLFQASRQCIFFALSSKFIATTHPTLF